jgi:hypothetical protein
MSEFKRFTSLESFAHVYRGQDYFDKKASIQYGAKIKLHGTNAAVRVSPDNYVTAQSRSRDITVDTDNCGFAQWVSLTHDAWAFPPSRMNPEIFRGDVIYYGEWAGKGIQKGDAVTQLDQKYFFVFGVYDEESNTMIVDPAAIEKTIPDLDQIVVLPWDFICEGPLDFNDAEACDKFATELNENVKAIGERDPFIYGMFDVDGPGEGWVLVPMRDPDGEADDTFVDMYWYERMAFKVKTEAHAVKKAKSASRDIEVPAGVYEFVDMFVTEVRCMQGLNEIGVYAAPELTSDFLKWIGQDIKKEGDFEMKDAGLEWKDVSKHVTQSARTWWLNKCQEIE